MQLYVSSELYNSYLTDPSIEKEGFLPQTHVNATGPKDSSDNEPTNTNGSLSLSPKRYQLFSQKYKIFCLRCYSIIEFTDSKCSKMNFEHHLIL